MERQHYLEIGDYVRTKDGRWIGRMAVIAFAFEIDKWESAAMGACMTSVAKGETLVNMVDPRNGHHLLTEADSDWDVVRISEEEFDVYDALIPGEEMDEARRQLVDLVVRAVADCVTHDGIDANFVWKPQEEN